MGLEPTLLLLAERGEGAGHRDGLETLGGRNLFNHHAPCACVWSSHVVLGVGGTAVTRGHCPALAVL